jgi:hypothetical protein
VFVKAPRRPARTQIGASECDSVLRLDHFLLERLERAGLSIGQKA